MDRSINSSTNRRQRTRKNSNRSQQTQINAIIKAEKIVNPEPPTFEVSHHYNQRFRFIVQSDVVAYPLNPSDFANLLLVALEDFTGGAQNAAPVYTRYLFKSMEMWALPTSLAAPVTLVLTPQNVGTTVVNTERTLTDTSKSIDRYAYVKYKPKMTSPIGQYQSQASTGGGIRITCPGSTIIDVVLHVWICNGEVPPTVEIFYSTIGSPPTIDAGQVFLAALDPSSTGTSLILPVAYANPYVNTDFPTPRP